MSYDLHNPAGTTPPLRGSAFNELMQDLAYWVERRPDKPRAVLGVPFYGYRWTSPGMNGEAVTYADILDTYGAMAAASDEVAQDGTTVYYDGEKTVAAK